LSYKSLKNGELDAASIASLKPLAIVALQRTIRVLGQLLIIRSFDHVLEERYATSADHADADVM
jgi:hypothetical protein